MDDLSYLDDSTAALFKTVATGTVQEIRNAIDNYQVRDKQYYHDKLCYIQMKNNRKNQYLSHYAAMYNTEDVLQLLITDFNFDIRRTDAYGVHPLMYALKNGMYKYVIANEDNYIMSAKDVYKNNIIHFCCGGGVNIPDFPGSRKPTVRNKDDCLDFIKYIVQQGKARTGIEFDVYHINQKGTSTLRCALDNKLYNVAVWILSQSETISNMSKVLQREAAKTWAEIGKCKINLVTCEKPLQYSTAIHVILEKLLTNKTYFTLQEMKNKLTQYVKNYGLDVNSTDHNGMTVLHYLCYHQYKQEAYGFKEGLIKLFVDLGTDPEIKDIRGYTSLMCAVEKGLVKLSDYTDPRVNNEVGIGKLLNARGRIQKTVSVGEHPALQGVTGPCGQQAVKTVPVCDHAGLDVTGQAVKQADVWTCPGCQQHPGKIKEMNIKLDKLMNDQGTVKDIVTLYAQNHEEILKKVVLCETDMNAYKVKLDEAFSVINQRLQKSEEEKEQLRELFEERFKNLQINHDKQIEILKESNEHLQNSLKEVEQKLEYQMKLNETLNSHLEDIEKDLKEKSLPAPPVGDLLIGDATIMDAYRHLEEGTEIISLPDAGTEEIEATLRKENKTYASVTIVTGNKDVCTERPVDELTELYKKLLTQAKTKSGKVVMSSLLPSVGGHEDCKRIETLNPVLNDVCTQLGVVFVDNDKNFKFMDGSVNEDFYSEDGEKLTKAGIKRLLKNLGLTAKRATRGGPATNI